MRTAVELFAGVGGFGLALERHGFDVVANVELDPSCRQVLKSHFPNAVQFNDVKEVTGEQLLRAGLVPDGGIITGGFPCQDLSVAGARAGLAGRRSGLFFEIPRLAAETNVEWLILENVPGLLSSHRGRDMAAVIGALADVGYGCAWRVLDAQYFGVTQRRRRVFIVARRAGDAGSCAQVLFERPSLPGHLEAGTAPGQIVTALTKNGVGTCGADDNQAQGGHLLAETLMAHHPRNDPETETFVAATVRSHPRAGSADPGLVTTTHTLTTEYDASEDGTGRGVPLVPETIGTIDAHLGMGGAGAQEAGNGHLIPETFVKVIRSGARDAEGNLPPEVWREEETHPTLSAFDNGDARTVTAIVEPVAFNHYRTEHGAGALAPTLQATEGSGQGAGAVLVPTLLTEREGKPGGGKGPLLSVDQSLTLATANGQKLFEDSAVRRLTPVECERLQGFPDGHTEGQSDSTRYKQMGNAVCVDVAEWVVAGLP